HSLATPEVGVADVVVRADGDEVVTAANEVDRLEEEELATLEAKVRVLPWALDRLAVLPTGPRVGSDVPIEGTRLVADRVERCRRSLLPEEVERYRALGRDAAAAMTEACSALAPADSEFTAAGKLARATLERGMEPVVLLVAGAGRLPRHRHPLPTTAPLGQRAMLIVCSRRLGLIANLTRLVQFGPV